MAWYTSKIGDQESGVEMPHSARSLASSINDGSTHFNLSSRSYDTSNSSVRYVNAAAFIENNAPQKTDNSSADNTKYSTMSETHSDIVPPLDIKSEENYPTTRDYTFSYRKHCEVAKMDLKPDLAYETWLSAKRKLLSDKALKRKEAEELKQKEIEERKRLAQEKYEKWLEKKSQCSINQESTTSTCVKPVTSLENRPRPQVTTEEARMRLAEWERAKRLEEERRRMLKRQEEQRRRQLEEQRRQMAAEAWENWIANVDKKPKPVPLNRGIFTLRGTVSDIFVNPNEWKPVIPIDHEN
ncbi:coiled-coil domain-containing protein 34-like [Lucilia sericata]|uniref:coiled-coil domain-containing protein 34-like n=1 Tax=Lucilia sericata TaxID=13632 RepID=UPI0018A8555E|nr:coiled-coil domain-containing protein 34-like [Lucilia sericata]